MAIVATQQISQAGTAAAYVAASAGGDKVTPGEGVTLHVKNAGAAAITVTVATPGKAFGLDIADLAVSVPAGGDRFVGPILPDAFRNPADGMADVTWSAVASVTFAVLKG